MQKLLEKKSTSKGNLLILESLLVSQNMTLSEAILTYMPMCTEIMVRCRLQHKITPCDQLFFKQIVTWAGACCVMSSSK